MKKKTQFKELQSKSLTQLTEQLAFKREELRDLNFKASQNQLKTVRAIRSLRTEIAQIMTAVAVKKTEK